MTAGFFRTLGTTLAEGREFDSDEVRPDGPRAIVLSGGLAHRAFGGHAALGLSVTVDGVRYTVAGVLPEEFWFPEAADAFVPLRTVGSVDDKGANTAMIGRLRPGIGLKLADSRNGSRATCERICFCCSARLACCF